MRSSKVLSQTIRSVMAINRSIYLILVRFRFTHGRQKLPGDKQIGLREAWPKSLNDFNSFVVKLVLRKRQIDDANCNIATESRVRKLTSFKLSAKATTNFESSFSSSTGGHHTEFISELATREYLAQWSFMDLSNDSRVSMTTLIG